MELELERTQRSGYETVLETTVTHAASELEKAGASLERLNELMGSQGEALKGVRRAYDETNLGRPEAPMPIDEE